MNPWLVALLYFVGYTTVALIVLYYLSFLAPETDGEDRVLMVMGAVFWPVTLVIAICGAILAGPIFLGVVLFEQGRRRGRERRDRQRERRIGQ